MHKVLMLFLRELLLSNFSVSEACRTFIYTVHVHDCIINTVVFICFQVSDYPGGIAVVYGGFSRLVSVYCTCMCTSRRQVLSFTSIRAGDV